MTDMNMRQRPSRTSPLAHLPWRTYRFFKGDPVYKIGAGMSYTTFVHTVASTTLATGEPVEEVALPMAELKAHIEQTRHRPHTAPVVLTVHVDVANTGERDGDEVLLASPRTPARAARRCAAAALRARARGGRRRAARPSASLPTTWR